jgi:hypothetical protein
VNEETSFATKKQVMLNEETSFATKKQVMLTFSDDGLINVVYS